VVQAGDVVMIEPPSAHRSHRPADYGRSRAREGGEGRWGRPPAPPGPCAAVAGLIGHAAANPTVQGAIVSLDRRPGGCWRWWAAGVFEQSQFNAPPRQPQPGYKFQAYGYLTALEKACHPVKSSRWRQSSDDPGGALAARNFEGTFADRPVAGGA